jgi:hypothetical protein
MRENQPLPAPIRPSTLVVSVPRCDRRRFKARPNRAFDEAGSDVHKPTAESAQHRCPLRRVPATHAVLLSPGLSRGDEVAGTGQWRGPQSRRGERDPSGRRLPSLIGLPPPRGVSVTEMKWIERDRWTGFPPSPDSNGHDAGTSVRRLHDRARSRQPRRRCLGRGKSRRACHARDRAEVGYSETAFATRLVGRGRIFVVRYFIPAAEVPFCGHATIATAIALA